MFEKKDDGKGNSSFQIRTIFSDILRVDGVAGVIAFMMIAVACTVILFQTFRNQPISLPPYLTEITALVFGYYFGTKRRKKKE